MEFLDSIVLTDVIPWLVGLLVAFVSARAWAGDKIKRALFVVQTVVAEVQQEYVDGLKAGKAPDSEDAGKLTEAERNFARNTAVEKAKTYLSMKGLGLAMWIMGWGGQKPDGWIGSQVEKTVADRKLAGK